MNNSKELCMKLLRSESDAEVDSVINADAQMSNPTNWFNLDDRETNNNTVSAQSSEPTKALIELVTNMTDAVLLKHVREAGIDPKDADKAPKTMYEAVDKHVMSLRGGRLINAVGEEKQKLKEFAKNNLVIGNTGEDRKRQCYTFVDNGEGQHPQDFPNTFLSLGQKYKSEIAFVQGMWNMGSSGVMRFCKYKLIISRRHDGSGDWGWTLVRKRPGVADALPVYEYFAIGDKNSIPSFKLGKLLPFKTREHGDFEGVSLETGTAIKLYSYYTDRTVSYTSVRDFLNENLVESVLPFWTYNFAVNIEPNGQGDRDKGVDDRSFNGLEYALQTSHSDEDETVLVDRIIDTELGEITIKAIFLKGNKDDNGNYKPKWYVGDRHTTKRSRVFFCVNGQVQYKEYRNYLSQCNLAAVMDRLAIIVDATKLSPGVRFQVWQANRQDIANTPEGTKFLNRVKDAIKNSDVLKEFNERIRKEKLEEASDAGNFEIIQRMVDEDKDIVNLLNGKTPEIHVPDAESTNGAPDSEFKGRYSPTYLKVRNQKIVKNGHSVPINRLGVVEIETDVCDGWLTRSKHPGELRLLTSDSGKINYRITLRSGKVNVRLEFNDDMVAEGDRIRVKLTGRDSNMTEDVESEEFEVIVTPPAKPARSGGSKRSGKARSGGTNIIKKPTPRHELVTEDGREVMQGRKTKRWSDIDGVMEGEDGGFAVDYGGENGLVIYINFDNPHHLKKLMEKKNSSDRELVSQIFVSNMLFSIISLENELAKAFGSNENSEPAAYKEMYRRIQGKSYAATALINSMTLPNAMEKSIGEREE